MEIAEYIILGLRLNMGIIKSEFKNRFNLDISNMYRGVIDKYVNNGLLYEDESCIKLTSRGRDFSNIVEVDFMP